MPNPRVVIGRKLNGNYGLRVSLSGNNALTADSSLGGFSFDDEWSDIVKVALAGVATIPGGSIDAAHPVPTTAIGHGLGYVPFIEARLLQGSVIYDDTFTLSGGSGLLSNHFSGAPCTIDTSNLNFQPQVTGPLSGGFFPSVGYSVIYIIYQIHVANPS